MPNLIVSTVGTSLLTNYANRQKDQFLSALLRDTANAGEKGLSIDQKKAIDRAAEEVKSALARAKTSELPGLSAELNSLYSYYGRRFWEKDTALDHHVLIATDTYQGQKTAEILQEHLKFAGIKSVEVYVPPGLCTKNRASFTAGVNEVVKWCEDTLPGYRQSRYHIVFNLVGGFKSLQGYMNTLGMFYADEIIYIFEAPTADLIRIPRLPVVMDEIPVLKEKAALFALLEHGYLAGREEVAGIPEIYLEFDDTGEHALLSTWGLLIWRRNKQKILGEELRQFPALFYERSFEKDFDSITDRSRRARVQSELAKASLLYREQGLEGLRRDGGYLYSNLEGKKSASGQTIGHFRLSDGWRITCVPDGSILRLRRVGPHAVNENP